MKRTTVIFLALAILLAHTLAIHQTPTGDFASPYDLAHVAFRLGRNIVHHGSAMWNPLGEAGEAYPSLLWILLAAVADKLQIYPTTVAQAVGILSTLSTIVVLAQFSPKRMVGLTAPVLLACSGAAAAAGSSGTEAASAMLLVSLAFLAYERGSKRLLSVSLCLLLFTRPEGALLLWVFLLLECLDRSSDEGTPRPRMIQPFIAPVLLVFAGMGFRQWCFGTWFSPLAQAVLGFDGERIKLGIEYGLSYWLSSGSALLLLLPAVLLCLGKLKGSGRRGLLLFLAWFGYVLLSGGDGLPFWNALVPTLPLAFLAVQRAVTHWLDRFPKQAPLAWCAVVASLLASLVVSKVPGDLGPLPLERILEAWMRPSPQSVGSFPHTLGRVGQLQEIRDTQRMRNSGLFFVGERKILGDARIGTFWPGSLGYLSRLTVIDLLNRATPGPDGRTQTWRGQPRVDLVQSLARPVDYLVLESDQDNSLSIAQRFHRWLSTYDSVGDTPERFRQLIGALRHFELVSVPVPINSMEPSRLSPRPYLLLRNKRLNLSPKLELRRAGRGLKLLVSHHGHRQVADLLIQLEDAEGNQWNLAPNGTWVPDPEVRARVNFLVYDTGERPFEIMSGALPQNFKQGSLRAHLLSSGSRVDNIMESNNTSMDIELP